jgi:TP901 family phage tail tape measure protein
LGDDEVAKRTAITIKAANASFSSSAKEMSEYLTAVWNSYQAGSDQLQSYVDIMAALGASTASSMEEIATSLSKVASTANVVGVSMEQMSSIVSTVSSVTRQSAESVGTAYKTILARMADLKMGKTLEDDVGLGQVSSTLQNIGVNILDATGELRDMGTVIEEIGAKWKTMSKAQ